jgi:serralysin
MSVAYQVRLTGAQETPPNGSTASGLGTVIFDDKAVTASYSFDIQGLDFGPVTSGQTPTDPNDVTRTHFHNQQAGVAGQIVFGQIDAMAQFRQDNDDLTIVQNPDGSWTLSGVWETTDPVNNSGLSIADFADVLGSAPVTTAVPLYFNVHTVMDPGGEIRGQLVAIADDNDNVVTGTAGNDRLPGLGGNDTILGLAGNDMLQGGNGKDFMDGGVGNDTLTGGKGPDLFVFNAGFGHDIITDFGKDDQIQFGGGLFQDAQAVLDASQQVGADTVITLDVNNTITLQEVQLSSLHEHDFLILA